MITVIIAGGSGTRLWPLSTPNYPKHLLKIGEDKLSLLQNTYRRVKKISSAIYVVSDVSHITHVREQLTELTAEFFIVEPARRGTANCIIAALAHISDQYSLEETITFTHADHYIRDNSGFQHSFKIAQKLAKNKGRIVLVGVEPSYPSTAFGYIEKGQLVSEIPYVFEVASFCEKPDYDDALSYLRSGNYLWNGGYFVGTVATFIRSMRQFSPELFTNYSSYKAASLAKRQKLYLDFAPAAIDYQLIERLPDLLVVPASFDWMDLGSFRDVSRAVGSDESGNYLKGEVAIEEVENSYIQNLEEKPVVVIGLDNIIVVNTAQGLLVARKDISQKVGDIVKGLSGKK